MDTDTATTSRASAAPASLLSLISSEGRSDTSAIDSSDLHALYRELEAVLNRKRDGVYVAGTAAWLAAELGSTTPTAIRIVEAILRDMQAHGRVRTRRLKSGETLWKIPR